MPLVDITFNPDFRIRSAGRILDLLETTEWLHYFAGDLPLLLTRHTGELGLDSDTPEEGVQVMLHDYGTRDINIADVWVKLQFSEDRPPLEERIRIRDYAYEILRRWFHERNVKDEDINLVMDLFWGPTNGRGTVNGVKIEW